MRNYKNNFRRNRYKSHTDRNHRRNENGSNFIRKYAGRNNHNASNLVEKYTSLAREAFLSGDKILSENYFQHAEHFIRLLEERDALNTKNNVSNELNKEKTEKDQKNINSLDQKISEQTINSEN